MMLAVTTLHFAHAQACCTRVEAPSRELRRVCVGRPGRLLQLMSWCVTSILSSPGRTSGALKSLLAACLCGAAWRRAALRRYNPGAAPDGCWHATPRQRHHCWGSCAGRRARQGPDLNPELAQASRCRLVVLGIEVGGRWSSQAAEFVRRPTRSRARAAPVAARAAVTSALALRWSALLAFAAARSFAASLLSLPLAATANVDGEASLLSNFPADSAEPPRISSRLA